MYQFLNGSDAAFADLQRRATNCCLPFPNQELPPGTRPRQGRVGFQMDPTNGSARLFVEHGIVYAGSNPAVRQWLEAGEIRFPSFDALKRWLREDLAAAYSSQQASEPANPPLRPEELTDLAAIHQDCKDPAAPVYLDAEALWHELTRVVRGQEDALRRLAQRVSWHVARCAPRRPATLMAVGPTGVGKTKAAETLPQALRALAPDGAGYSYLRLDMTEYQERHRISQLLGAPPGYIGYGEGAALVDALVANPRTIVLFDEIEKAHPDVFRTLMNVMDAGRLSPPARTAQGRDVDCRRAIFLFTSNLDCHGILEDLEERDAFGDAAAVDAVCRQRLRAAGLASELVGRIGSFLVFRPLSLDTRAEIVTLAVVRVAAEYGLCVEHVAPAVILAVLKASRGEGFGARPDEYLVDDLLGDCFARAAAAGLRSAVSVHGGPTFTCVPFKVPMEDHVDKNDE